MEKPSLRFDFALKCVLKALIAVVGTFLERACILFDALPLKNVSKS